MEIALPLLKAAGGLVIILAGCELFTNGIEWVGCRLNLSQGAVGSVLAAVGTALPETLVPIVAIVFIGGEKAHEIGIGGILGAPFMLATLGFTITGAAGLLYAKRREHGARMAVSTVTLGQDLKYFVWVYALAVASSPLLTWLDGRMGENSPMHTVVRVGVAIALVGAYLYYVWLHMTREEEGSEAENLCDLYFHRNCVGQPRLRFILTQVIVALVAIFAGAHVFVSNLEHVATGLSISPLVLSIIVTPIATELPEKFNSILWMRQGKDTLATGNITGAMVFQSCIPVAVGVTMTKWALNTPALASAVVALVSGAIVYLYMRKTGHLSAKVLLLGLPLYVAWLFIAFGTN